MLKVRMRGGETREKRVDSSRGGPGRALTDDELETKARLGAEQVIGAEQADALIRSLRPDADLSPAELLALTVHRDS